jgi:phosphoribosylformylglycinamidine synthase subunit PurL
MAEAVLNIACVGARPIAVVDCLNFGNPEHPEVMWQLSEAIDGMADACRAFGLPVIGGNVSLYNETDGVDIHPTPVVGMLGLVDRLDNRPPGPSLVAGDRVLQVGPMPSGGELGGSAWAWRQAIHGGELPALDTTVHTAVAALVRGLVGDGVVSGLHDVATGGAASALGEMAVASGVGARVTYPADDLFSEAPSRVLLSVPEGAVGEVRSRAEALGVDVADLGEAGGDRLTVDGALDLPLDTVVTAWRDRLPAALGAGVTQG